MLAPAVLLAVGVWLLAGCVFIPTSDKPIRGSDAAREVGAEKSSRPIGLHRATRDEVIRLLGAPHYESADQTRIAYEWAVSDGVWVFPLCFTGYRQEGVRALLLTFDEAGVLRTSEVLRANGNFIHPEAAGLHVEPSDMQWRGTHALSARRQPTTGPADRAASQPSRGAP